MPQFIYTMKGLGKVHPPDKSVLEDIWLSFYFGAKIGVLGANGAGKSTLLRIMAGQDTQLPRRSVCRRRHLGRLSAAGAALDPPKDVLGNVEEGVAAIKALLTRYDEVNAKLGEDLSPEEMDKVLDEQSRCRTRSTRPTPGTSTRGSRSRWTRCACRPPTPTSRRCPAASGAAWRCAACCCRSPTCCCSTSRPTTSTPSRSRGWSAS